MCTMNQEPSYSWSDSACQVVSCSVPVLSGVIVLVTVLLSQQAAKARCSRTPWLLRGSLSLSHVEAERAKPCSVAPRG